MTVNKPVLQLSGHSIAKKCGNIEAKARPLVPERYKMRCWDWIKKKTFIAVQNCDTG